MSDFLIKTLVPVIIALISAIGAFSFQLDYERGKNQEKIGHLVVTLTRGCQTK